MQVNYIDQNTYPWYPTPSLSSPQSPNRPEPPTPKRRITPPTLLRSARPRVGAASCGRLVLLLRGLEGRRALGLIHGVQPGVGHLLLLVLGADEGSGRGPLGVFVEWPTGVGVHPP